LVIQNKETGFLIFYAIWLKQKQAR